MFLNSFFLPVATFFSHGGHWAAEQRDFFFSIGGLKNKNSDLTAENLKLKAELAKLKVTEKENEDLRTQMELAPKENFSYTAALVLGKEISGQRQVLVIDKGSRDNIEKGAAVVIGEGVLIGRITEVFEKSATVQLLIDRESKINVEVLEAETQGIMNGQFGTSAKVEMLPRTEQVNRGDTIISSGLGETLPRGLLVGYIKEVTETSDQLFQEALVSFPEDFKKIKLVLVVKSVNEN
ncbi:MAG TPA: rod shape-determining protein MreC [Candidatus Moranbacteria bacterium]|nr:rod shape-determining protein MreC [Candidatus Moranbacteria bacterium]